MQPGDVYEVRLITLHTLNLCTFALRCVIQTGLFQVFLTLKFQWLRGASPSDTLHIH